MIRKNNSSIPQITVPGSSYRNVILSNQRKDSTQHMADPGKQLGFPKSSEKSSPPPRSWQPNSENKGPAAYQATSRGKGKREIEKKPQGPSYDDYRKDLTGVANNRAQYEFEASTIYKNFNNHPERRNTAAKDIEELKRNAAAAPRYKAPR